MGTNYYWIKEQIRKDERIARYLDVKLKQDIAYFSSPYDRFSGIGGYSSDCLDGDDELAYFYHIGKRSGAGYYCKKCHVSSCKAGENGVHYSKFDSYDHCPVCGKEWSKDDITTTFTFYDLNRDRYLLHYFKDSDKKLIKDEYDEEYTVKEFLDEVIEGSMIIKTSKSLFS